VSPDTPEDFGRVGIAYTLEVRKAVGWYRCTELGSGAFIAAGERRDGLRVDEDCEKCDKDEDPESRCHA
jgi:hypothetical protein